MSTEKVLVALKSFGKTNQKIGVDREQAAADFLCARGHTLLATRLKTPFAEVDIFSRGTDGYGYICEVKGPAREGLPVISRQQLQRLARARTHLANHYKMKIRVILLLVALSSAGPKVEVIDDLSLQHF